MYKIRVIEIKNKEKYENLKRIDEAYNLACELTPIEIIKQMEDLIVDISYADMSAPSKTVIEMSMENLKKLNIESIEVIFTNAEN